MATKNIQRMGNSKGVVLTSELKAAGLSGQVEVTVQGDKIVIGAVRAGVVSGPKPGRNRQSFSEAMSSTFKQYNVALTALANAAD